MAAGDSGGPPDDEGTPTELDLELPGAPARRRRQDEPAEPPNDGDAPTKLDLKLPGAIAIQHVSTPLPGDGDQPDGDEGDGDEGDGDEGDGDEGDGVEGDGVEGDGVEGDGVEGGQVQVVDTFPEDEDDQRQTELDLRSIRSPEDVVPRFNPEDYSKPARLDEELARPTERVDVPELERPGERPERGTSRLVWIAIAILLLAAAVLVVALLW
jgi:hypothetical protein